MAKWPKTPLTFAAGFLVLTGEFRRAMWNARSMSPVQQSKLKSQPLSRQTKTFKLGFELTGNQCSFSIIFPPPQAPRIYWCCNSWITEQGRIRFRKWNPSFYQQDFHSPLLPRKNILLRYEFCDVLTIALIIQTTERCLHLNKTPQKITFLCLFLNNVFCITCLII